MRLFAVVLLFALCVPCVAADVTVLPADFAGGIYKPGTLLEVCTYTYEGNTVVDEDYAYAVVASPLQKQLENAGIGPVFLATGFRRDTYDKKTKTWNTHNELQAVGLKVKFLQKTEEGYIQKTGIQLRDGRVLCDDSGELLTPYSAGDITQNQSNS